MTRPLDLHSLVGALVDPFHGGGMSEGETVVPNDPLDRQYKLAARIGLERKQPIVQHIDVPQTFRPLAGLRQNQRGQIVRVNSADPDENLLRTVVQCRSPGDDAESIIVTLGPITFESDVDPATTGLDVRLVAKLTWGMGGAQYSTEIDWVNGTLLSFPVNFLRVDVMVPDNVLAVPIPPPFLVSASIAYGCVPGTRNRARRTIDIGTLAPGATSAPIPVPNYAVGMTLQTSTGAVVAPGPVTPLNIHQFDEAVLGFVRADYTYASAGNDAWTGTDMIPIAQGARFVEVRNDSALTSVFTTAVFDIPF